MKLLVFTKEDAEETINAKELGQKLEEEGIEVEYFDSEGAEALSKIELYDVYSTPTFIAVRDDGSLVNIWRGYIPPAGEVQQQVRG